MGYLTFSTPVFVFESSVLHPGTTCRKESVSLLSWWTYNEVSQVSKNVDTKWKVEQTSFPFKIIRVKSLLPWLHPSIVRESVRHSSSGIWTTGLFGSDQRRETKILESDNGSVNFSVKGRDFYSCYFHRRRTLVTCTTFFSTYISRIVSELQRYLQSVT